MIDKVQFKSVPSVYVANRGQCRTYIITIIPITMQRQPQNINNILIIIARECAIPLVRGRRV